MTKRQHSKHHPDSEGTLLRTSFTKIHPENPSSSMEEPPTPHPQMPPPQMPPPQMPPPPVLFPGGFPPEGQGHMQGVYTGGDVEVGFIEMLFTCLTYILCCPFLILSYRNVKEYQRAVIFRMGRLKHGGAAGPGVFLVVPCIDDCQIVDLRTMAYDVPSQSVLTHDSVTVAVDAVVYYRVCDPILFTLNVTNGDACVRLLSACLLRRVLGLQTLSQLLSDRDKISAALKEVLDVATDPWGVKVERVEMKDVKLPDRLLRAMAAEAEATREGKAKIVAAEGEVKASRALKDAADMMSSSPGALQLRNLRALEAVSENNNISIIIPQGLLGASFSK